MRQFLLSLHLKCCSPSSNFGNIITQIKAFKTYCKCFYRRTRFGKITSDTGFYQKQITVNQKLFLK